MGEKNSAKNICFYFQVHQPFRLRTYRFFDIGQSHHYYDDVQNKWLCRRIADKCYLPANALILELIRKYEGKFKVAYSITGTALEQFKLYCPEVISSFQELVKTGCVELLGETYMHSLAALKSEKEFAKQVKMHGDLMEELFGVKPQVFRNTELIYSDEIGRMVRRLGFKAQCIEGAKQMLGWRSPNFIYEHRDHNGLKLLCKNYQLSDDIAFRFSQHSWAEFPLTGDKYVLWLNALENPDCVNLFMDYETFGEHQWKETGIFEFLRHLPERVFADSDFSFATPSMLVDSLEVKDTLSTVSPLSWADEERDISAWLGNDIQNDAFDQIYALEEQVKSSENEDLISVWRHLQTSDNFYYMCTKWFSDGDVHKYFNHYSSPYEAYVNYMNILSDFRLSIEAKHKD
ncbi:MAG: glycoside hydrolase family 57 protein [Bacteroidales bacterium]|nr:glycoside hydrolase family 57 protein [Bacteroidales bacterium]